MSANHHQRVSLHACRRWNQRVRDEGSTWRANSRIESALRLSVTIPNRLAARWIRHHDPDLDAHFRRAGVRYRYYPGAVMITTTKHTVVTVLQSQDDDLATVLVWLMTGFWEE